MDTLATIEKKQLRQDVTPFRVGDTVKVHFRIIEGATERIQVFEGLVIAMHNGAIRKTFCVRKISFGIGVERIFNLHSPRIQKIERVKRGKVRKAKLYYIRDRVGKVAKVKERLGSGS